MTNEDEPFLQRWSRRKSKAKRGPEAPGEPKATDSGASVSAGEPGAGPPGAETPVRSLTEADFADVDFEALDFNSDYTRFLVPGVPDSVKTKALRKLWASDPIFSQPDPLQDYAGDFTDKALAVPPGTLKTAYRIGRGFLSDDELAEWEKLGNSEEANAVAADPTPGSARPAEATSIRLESPEQPEIRALIAQSDAYMAALYPAESNHLVDIAALCEAHVCFLVARSEGAALGCGALVLDTAGNAEIKRMFVAPAARGRKIGRQLLDALEEQARASGVRRIWLETGNRQPEALQLYRSAGFVNREPFGSYSNDPNSFYLEKWLD
jgi:putative acetyltransferase